MESSFGGAIPMTLNILWIDDDVKRASLAEDINASFESVRNKSVAETINKIQKKPDLVIIDHFLDSTRDIRKGSTAAELIREKWPLCPIVGITAASKLSKTDFYNVEIYEDLYDVSSISDKVE